MGMDTDALAENIVAAGEWLPYEVYVAWVLEHEAPESSDPELNDSADPDSPTVAPQAFHLQAA